MTSQIKVPDELWYNLLAKEPCGPGGMQTAIRLSDGTILENIVISDRGFILGQEASGLPGSHGKLDTSRITFTPNDIAAIQVPKRHVWNRTQWVSK